MKLALLTIAILFTNSVWAKTMDGLYEIPVDDPALEVYNKFTSSIKYNGGDLLNASKITVTLPQEMMGISNDFILKKEANGTWKSESDIFDNLSCEMATKFECFMDFKDSAVKDITGSDPNLLSNNVNQVPFLLMDIEKAKNLMVNQGLDQNFIDNRINIIRDFVVEPRGILSYEFKTKRKNR